MSHCPECAESELIKRLSDKLAVMAREAIKAERRIESLTALVKKYRAESIEQGAADEDLTEIDDVLKEVGQ